MYKMHPYWFLMNEDTGKPISAWRWKADPGGQTPERWDGEKWVFDPYLIGCTGMGGDDYGFKQTTEEEISKFIKKPTGKKPITDDRQT